MNLKDQEYKYSYKGLFLWLVFFVLSYVVLMFLPIDVHYLASLTLCVTGWNIVLLTYMMYKNEYIYWYNAVGYDEAKEAGSQRRKEYAYKHLIVFFKAALLHTIISIMMFIFKLSYIINIFVFLVVFVVAAILTFKIKL